jgi:hypothetical protein
VGYDVQRKRVVKEGAARTFTHIHVDDLFPVELTLYETALLGHRFKSSITGKPIERATAEELARRIAHEHAAEPSELKTQLADIEQAPDRWQVYEALLWPLERVEQSRRHHPEGDALYHSLQVYELALDEMPYDEEFLLAALLHDVGKAIDPEDHVSASVEALADFVSPRTLWLIAHHMEGHALREKTIGARRRRRLAEHPWFEDLLVLSECDAGGRVPGAQVVDLPEALQYIRDIESMFG